MNQSFNISIRPFAFLGSSAAPPPANLVEDLVETFDSGAGQTVFNTTKDFIGAPTVFLDGSLQTFGFAVTGAKQITFDAPGVDEGTQVTIAYLGLI